MQSLSESMWSMAMPWWEFILRACVVYVGLLVFIRLSGKRSIGQFTPFDMVLLVLLGNAVQNALLGSDDSVGGGLLLAATLIGLNWCVGAATARSPRLESLIEGEPVLLARDGTVFHQVLRRQMISHADFDKAMREYGIERIDDLQLAFLETDGKITIVARRDGAH